MHFYARKQLYSGRGFVKMKFIKENVVDRNVHNIHRNISITSHITLSNLIMYLDTLLNYMLHAHSIDYVYLPTLLLLF